MTHWPDNHKGLIFNQINCDILVEELSPFHIEYYSLGPVKCQARQILGRSPVVPLVIRLSKCMCANIDAVD